MKPVAITLALVGAAGFAQSYQPCNGVCVPSMADIEAMKFGYAVQNLLYQYYKSVPVNQTFFSNLPNENTEFLSNAMGLQRQAWLGIEAL